MGVTTASPGFVVPKDPLLPMTVTRRHVVRAVLLAAVGTVGAYQLTNLAEPGGLGRAALAFLVGWVLCVALVASRGRGGVYSPAAAYLSVFGLFHGGLLLTFSLPDAIGPPASELHWFLGGHGPVAATLASIGMITFALAAELVAAGASRSPERSSGSGEHALGVLGLGVQVAGLVVFAGVVLSDWGFGPLVFGYAAYLEAAQDSALLGYSILALGVGPVLAIAGGGRERLLSWWLFLAYTLVAFPLGLRGEVLFPLVAMLVVEVRRGRRIRPLWTVTGVLIVMTLIGVVRETRTEGIGALPNLSTLASPLDAAAELGSSLRPTVVVLGWHDRGEPFRHGATLLVVPIRAVEKLLGHPPPAFDDRLFNAEILARVGPIGASPVAEAYHNFGTAGVVGFMAFLGVLMGLLTRIDRTPANDALLGALLVVFLIQVRNSFAPVPLQIVLIVGLLGLARVVARAGDEKPRPDRGKRA